MFIYDAARKINTYRKAKRKAQAGRYLSPVRRIERTAPLSSRKLVAMTFDDGPSAAAPQPLPRGTSPGSGLTEYLLDVLKAYDAKGTFDVIGTTEFNYPDKPGKEHSFSWGGQAYDHYPDFGQDRLAGIKNQPALARRMVSEGHELANHGYKHVLFGPMKLVYGGRKSFDSLEAVVEDLTLLHRLAEKELGYTMRLARPPHYIDKIRHGATSYDAYRKLNYNYLAASFDGGGWKPTSGSYAQDVQQMIEPLKAALSKDPMALNGQIIFQKDGCNMSRQTPVADALGPSLALLKEYGYQVVTASDLLEASPFEDIDDRDPAFESVRRMVQAGYCIGYKNNTFGPQRLVTEGELVMMFTPPGLLQDPSPQSCSYARHPYAAAIAWAASRNWFGKVWPAGSFSPDTPLEVEQFVKFLDVVSEGRDVNFTGTKAVLSRFLKRNEVMDALAGLCLTNPRG